MTYAIKEMFFTLQGEGAQTGRPAVFLRFSGCNLWSGREEDRAASQCRFCDTDFVGIDGMNGGRFSSALDLARAAFALWPRDGDSNNKRAGRPLLVATGGEPLLQLDAILIAALHDAGFEIAVETNGTILAPAGIDWLCVSPKAGATLAQLRGDELKLVFPQRGLAPESLEHLDFGRFSLQPMDGPDREENTRAALAFCLARPLWRLSLQTHKWLGIP